MKSEELKKVKISLIMNIVIVVFTIFASVLMFTGLKFMAGEDILESSAIGMFKFFTVDSNLFMGIVALVFAINQIELLRGKKSKISKTLYIFNLMATVSVSVTFLTVFGYLGWIVDGGMIVLLRNSNLFFHLLTPLIAIIKFIFFDKTEILNFKDTLYGVVPTIAYSIYYMINALVHIENGKVPPTYDWYWFVQGGLWQMIIVIPLMYGASYLISFVIWKLNKIHK